MEDLESLTLYQMMERRNSTEQEVSRLIGQLVFAFSRLVQGLHLCVAWHDDGRQLRAYPSVAQDLGAAALIKRIKEQAALRFGESVPYQEYAAWSERADEIRQHRNIIMHSTWSVEAYGRHAIAISTPVFVEPARTHTYSVQQLVELCEACSAVQSELSRLRKRYPL